MPFLSPLRLKRISPEAQKAAWADLLVFRCDLLFTTEFLLLMLLMHCSLHTVLCVWLVLNDGSLPHHSQEQGFECASVHEEILICVFKWAHSTISQLCKCTRPNVNAHSLGFPVNVGSMRARSEMPGKLTVLGTCGMTCKLAGKVLGVNASREY